MLHVVWCVFVVYNYGFDIGGCGNIGRSVRVVLVVQCFLLVLVFT